MKHPWPLVLALVALAHPASATDLGIDMNQPVSGVGTPNTDAVPAIAGKRAAWVRVDFDRAAWTGPTDATPHGPGQLTWFEAYDALIDGYLAKGVQVYGLLGAGITNDGTAQDGDAWQASFTDAASAIVDHYKGRVRVYEVYNEPNNWVAPNTPALDPSAFAHLLARTYQAVKIDHAADPCWQVDLVSGPILSLDVTTGAAYLTQTYDAGKASFGWDAIKAQTGTYPLDGVGYHIYVAQGGSETTSTVAAAVTANLDAFWGAITGEEGAGTGKGIYVSEFGWRTGAVSPDQQADFMEAGLGAMDASGHVRTAIWFSLQDFGASDEWGIYSGPPYDAANEKPSAARFALLAASHRPSLAAFATMSSIPASIPVGGSASISIAMQNDGTSAWPASSANPVRFGAASGCPNAADTNALAWSAFANGGYANSLTDARAFASGDTPAGSAATYSFMISAPAGMAPGSYRVAGRMVKEGVAWFGSTFAATVDVVNGEGGGAAAVSATTTASEASSAIGAGGSSGAPSAAAASGAGGAAVPASEGDATASGCGCVVGSEAPSAPRSLWIILAAIGLIRARRRSAHSV